MIQLRMSIFFKKENWFESSVDIFRTLKVYVLSRKKKSKRRQKPRCEHVDRIQPNKAHPPAPPRCNADPSGR